MRCSAAICLIVSLTLLIGMSPPGPLLAQERAPEAERLDSAIEEVLQKRVYQWRMPRPEGPSKEEKPSGPIASFFKWLGDGFLSGLSFVVELFRDLIEWLESLGPDHPPPREDDATGWMTPVRSLLTILLVILAVGLIFGLVRFWKNRPQAQTNMTASATAAAPDLTDEEISADELPADRWLGLARQMIDQGNLRLAMRAYYLATLARLAERELLTIEFYKSNLDYKRELDRRGRDKIEMQAAFGNSILRFERTWYGLKEITRAELDEFAALQETIIGAVES